MKIKPYIRFWVISNGVILCVLILGALFTDKAVTTISEQAYLQQRRCFVIDAGHGGIDGGATSCTGVLESRINLEIALRLNDLMHLMGYDTQMIRTTDRSMHTRGNTIAAQKVSDLKERVRLVNQTENAVLVSIHQNYFSDDRYAGPQVFYGAGEGSAMLAKEMQTALVSTLKPGSRRLAKKADGIYLMQNISAPGVLIECGFLSNHDEEAKLRDGAYQKELSCVIASVLSKFNSNTEIA